uniref:Uncharacterized protein n=1 Tax=viral metagenome TaxID=1070528 RepID=A0A6C0EJY1_9ZZZZ
MYSKIVNPVTNKYVNINGKLGQQIIKNYVKLIGGANPSSLEKKRIKNRKKKARQRVNKAVTLAKELEAKKLLKLSSMLKDPDRYNIESNTYGNWFITDAQSSLSYFVRISFVEDSEDIEYIYFSGLSLNIFNDDDDYIIGVKSREKIAAEELIKTQTARYKLSQELAEQSQATRAIEFDKVKELLHSLDLNNVNKSNINSILNTINESADINLIMDFIKFNYFNSRIIIGKGDGGGDISQILHNLIGICKTLLILNETNKKIYIIVPGDSGYRQMKVTEYLLNNKHINFIYIPISGIKRVNGDEIKDYFYQKIKHIPITDLILIYDSRVRGISITFIKTQLDKHDYKNIMELEFPNHMNIEMFLESDKDKRCTPYYADVTKELTKIDTNICKYVILFLYYKIISGKHIKELGN